MASFLHARSQRQGAVGRHASSCEYTHTLIGRAGWGVGGRVGGRGGRVGCWRARGREDARARRRARGAAVGGGGKGRGAGARERGKVRRQMPALPYWSRHWSWRTEGGLLGSPAGDCQQEPPCSYRAVNCVFELHTLRPGCIEGAQVAMLGQANKLVKRFTHLCMHALLRLQP